MTTRLLMMDPRTVWNSALPRASITAENARKAKSVSRRRVEIGLPGLGASN